MVPQKKAVLLMNGFFIADFEVGCNLLH